MTKYVRFSDRDPGALRSRLNQINKLFLKLHTQVSCAHNIGLNLGVCPCGYDFSIRTSETLEKIKRVSKIE